MKKNILFVCLGNICRSPSAESVFKKIVSTKNISHNFYIDSAGTSACHIGEKADSRMRETASKRNIDITSRSRQFTHKDYENFDYIIAMDDSNMLNILALAQTQADHSKVSKMTDYASTKQHNHIPDPYYGGNTGFELVMDLLDDCCNGLLKSIYHG
jgi:protein-tyrosine phosphatase